MIEILLIDNTSHYTMEIDFRITIIVFKSIKQKNQEIKISICNVLKIKIVQDI